MSFKTFASPLCSVSKYSEVRESDVAIKSSSKGVKFINPKEIKEFLDQYVIGQDDAKKALAVALHNHYKRINASIDDDDDDDIKIEKSNILMIGDSGTGKTLLAQTVAKMLDVPFLVVDATTFTPSGYKGKDVESIIANLLQVANNDKRRAEMGIVYIDEFDKIASNSFDNSLNVGLSLSTQAVFLKLLEGDEIEVEAKSDMSYLLSSSESITISTKNILFICGGAFVGIENLVGKKENKVVGFGVEFLSKDKVYYKNREDFMSHVGVEEVIKYGLMPEIVGRLPVILKLKTLNKDDLVAILTQPKNAIIKQYRKLLSIDGVYLDFSRDALDLIAELALSNKTGARGLRNILEEFMIQIMFDVPVDGRIRTCIVTADNIKNNLVPSLDLLKFCTHKTTDFST